MAIRSFIGISVLLLLFSCQSSPERIELAKDYYNVGNAYFELEKYDKAVEYYDRALELDPSINQAVFNLARTKIETKDYRRALKLLNSLRESDPENIMVLEMVGYTYYRMEAFADAVAVYLQILDINPYNKKALYNISVLEVEQGHTSAARMYLEKLQQLEDKAEYRLLLAEMAAEDGDLYESIRLYESILLDDKKNRDVYSALKDLYLQVEQYTEVLTVYNELVSTSKDSKEKSILLFEWSRIEFLYIEDMVSAQEHLIEALKAGFGSEDQSDLESLMEETESPIKEQIQKIIDENLIIKDPEDPDKSKAVKTGD